MPHCTLAGSLAGQPWTAVASVGQTLSIPHRNKCQCEEGQGQKPVIEGASLLTPCPPWRLWQVCRCRSPGAQTLRSLHDASSLGLCPPRGLRPRMWQGRAGWQGVQGGHRRAGRTHNSGPLPWHAQCPRGARRCQTLRHRTFYPSGGCAGTESWKRPFPGSA